MPIHAHTFPVFEELAVCEKCRCPTILTDYCDGLRAMRVLCQAVVGEHFHRRCARCGYGWYERPRRPEDEVVAPPGEAP